MVDPRIERLADVLVGYSCSVQPGEGVLISSLNTPPEMICAIMERVIEAGGIPFVHTTDYKVARCLYRNATVEQMDILAKRDLAFMKNIQCCIGFYGELNNAQFSDVSLEKLHVVEKHWMDPVTDYRERNTRWVLLNWPTPAMAQCAGMSTEAFEDFYFEVCTLDYERLARAQQPLQDRMIETDMVRIEGPMDTRISFSIKQIPAVACAGKRNIPDGELFTAPIKDSVNGVIQYNAGTIYHGKSFDDVRLAFKNGAIVEATSTNTRGLNDILDTDAGSRYVGEFAIGLNPRINRAMRDILFDEKIAGSLHFTPGEASKEADNGNRSGIHWDMVLLQTPEFGGGEIYFDDELIRRDGHFVPDYLQGLNPENLAANS